MQAKTTLRFHLTAFRMPTIKKTLARCQWLTPVILATKEAEIRGSWFKDILGK
jgi:hypothetical protein